MTYWGYHLILDCAECNNNIKSKDSIYDFVTTLVKEIDMEAYGDPIIEFMLPGDEKQGHTLIQLITTSNICAHFVDIDNSAYIDIFSCKQFDVDQAKKVILDFFQPKKIRVNFITRNAG